MSPLQHANHQHETIRPPHILPRVQSQLREAVREDQVPRNRYVDIRHDGVEFVLDLDEGFADAFVGVAEEDRAAVVSEHYPEVGVGYVEYKRSESQGVEAGGVSVVGFGGRLGVSCLVVVLVEVALVVHAEPRVQTSTGRVNPEVSGKSSRKMERIGPKNQYFDRAIIVVRGSCAKRLRDK